MPPPPEREKCSLPLLALENLRANWKKDGSRTVVYGGDPYEDDVERVSPPAAQPRECNHRRPS
jgi:hypothetical protein